MNGRARAADPFPGMEDELPGEATRIDPGILDSEQATELLAEKQAEPFLRCENGKDKGKDYVLGFGESGIGRSIDNEVILTDIAVSRKHLKVIRDPNGALRLNDLGSGNGTKLNGAKVREAILKQGDRIEIGETCLVVQTPGVPEPSVGRPQLGPPSGVVVETGYAPTVQASALMPPPQPMPQHVPGGQPPPGYPQPTDSGHTDETAMPGGAQPFAGVPGPGGTTPFAMPAPSAGPPTPQAGTKSPMLPIVAIAAIVLVGVVAVSIAVVVKSRSGQTAAATPAGSETVLQAGLVAFQQRHWDEADAAFHQVLVTTPGDARATAYLGLVAEARVSEQRIAVARQQLAAGDPNGAMAQVALVPPTSPLALDAQAIRNAAAAAGAQPVAMPTMPMQPGVAMPPGMPAMPGLPGQPLALPTQPAMPAYPTQPLAVPAQPVAVPTYPTQPVAPAQPVYPTQPVRPVYPVPTQPVAVPTQPVVPAQPAHPVVAQNDHHAAPEHHASPTHDHAPAPVHDTPAAPAGHGNAAMLAAYRGGDFAGAAAQARAAHQNDLAASIDRFGRDYTRVHSLTGPLSDANVHQVEALVHLDEQISDGAAYSRPLRQRLLDTYLAAARDAWPRGQYAQACAKTRLAANIDVRNALVRELISRCEGHAQQLIGQAQAAAGSNRTQAQTLYHQAMDLVPQSSPTYQRAYQASRALGTGPAPAGHGTTGTAANSHPIPVHIVRQDEDE